jgi:pimeloyl-ACP methyl ester carboxylesterase
MSVKREAFSELSVARELYFAGDEVRLAGQIDYPVTSRTPNGFPLVFVLHHAGGNTRESYQHFAQMALECDYAVFRWDKRGTGRSGASARGSAVQDAVNAYETALEQPGINRKRVFILAIAGGTELLGGSFGLFARIQRPFATLLVASILDPEAILAIDTPIQIVVGKNDWNPWQTYAVAASNRHNQQYSYGASYYVAPNADRMLMIQQNGETQFHEGARKVIQDWLNAYNLPSTSG